MTEISHRVEEDNYLKALRGIERLEDRVKAELGTDMAARARAHAGRMIYDKPETDYVRTYRLYNGIDSRRDGNDVEVFCDIPGEKYPIYVHEGTRHMAPRPFLAQAARDEEERLAFIAARIAAEEGLR